jgi:hypothetical protein
MARATGGVTSGLNDNRMREIVKMIAPATIIAVSGMSRGITTRFTMASFRL